MRALLALLFALLPLAMPPPATAASAESGRIIVKWRVQPGAFQDDAAEARALRRRTGKAVRLVRGIGGGMSVLQQEQPTDAAQVRATIAALRADPQVESAEPDRRVHAHAYVPNDPLFALQWHLGTGQPAAIGADEAWLSSRGGDNPATSPVVIAVIDTGVLYDHPDLGHAYAGGKLLPGYDFVSADWEVVDGATTELFATANDGDGWDPDPSDPGDFISRADLDAGPFMGKGCGLDGSDDTPLDSSWHGTRVSGLIAANTDNAIGIAGTGFNVRVLPIRALGKCGGYDSDIIAALYWAAGVAMPASSLESTALPPNPYPAQVINISLGSLGPCSPQYREVIRTLGERGVLVVASAGNEGKAVDSPANCPGVLAVAGLRHTGTKVGYSNLGPEVGLAAPGGNCGDYAWVCQYQLVTTTNSGEHGPAEHTYTSQFDIRTANVGTSFAAPLVSATAGLMKAVNPALSATALAQRLRTSARPFPTDRAHLLPACTAPEGELVQDEECQCNTAVCGAGMLDAAAALAEALRPAAVAEVRGVVGPARILTLDGSGSAAASGRRLATYRWSVAGTSGGAQVPSITAPDQAIARVESPLQGSLTLRLDITDDTGAADHAEVAIEARPGGGTTTATNPPPASGGGGSTSLPALCLLATLLGLRMRQRTNP